MCLIIPTERIGSIPRQLQLVEASIAALIAASNESDNFHSDTYSVEGLPTAADNFMIPFIASLNG